MTPSGSPAWTRAATIGDYGGDTSKANFLSQGVVDPLTDVDCTEFARMTADLVAAVRTAPFCILTYKNDDTTDGDDVAAAASAPTIYAVYMMTGVTLVRYQGDSPPSGFPSAARNGDGDVTFTFASTYADEYAVSGTFTPEHASASAQESTSVKATAVVSGQTVRVRCFTGGVAVLDKRVTLEVS